MQIKNRIEKRITSKLSTNEPFFLSLFPYIKKNAFATLNPLLL